MVEVSKAISVPNSNPIVLSVNCYFNGLGICLSLIFLIGPRLKYATAIHSVHLVLIWPYSNPIKIRSVLGDRVGGSRVNPTTPHEYFT